MLKFTFDLKDGTLKESQPVFSDEFVAGKEIANPKGSYVYGHYTIDGKLFYVGKGVGNRAWSIDRHPVWQHYLEKHLNGVYKIRIIQDGLSDDAAEELEESLIGKYGFELVNWVNFGRKTDFAALNEYHRLRNANKALIAAAKKFEVSNPDEAVKMYRQAIDSTMQYQSMDTEAGLVGQIMKEIQDERGYAGELEALNRLTMCLCNLGRVDEAFADTQDYFTNFKADLALRGSGGVIKRVEKKSKKSLGLTH